MRATAPPVADSDEAVLSRSGMEALEAERTIEAEGRVENLRELIGVAGEFDANRGLERAPPRRSRRSTSSCSRSRCWRPGLARTDEELVTLMTLHNAKGGARVRGRAHDRHAEKGFPALRARSRGTSLEEERRPGYVGGDARQAHATLTYAQSAQPVRGGASTAVALPRPRSRRSSSSASRRDEGRSGPGRASGGASGPGRARRRHRRQPTASRATASATTSSTRASARAW